MCFCKQQETPLLQFVVLCDRWCSWLGGCLLCAPSPLAGFSLEFSKAGLFGLQIEWGMDMRTDLVLCQAG